MSKTKWKDNALLEKLVRLAVKKGTSPVLTLTGALLDGKRYDVKIRVDVTKSKTVKGSYDIVKV